MTTDEAFEEVRDLVLLTLVTAIPPGAVITPELPARVAKALIEATNPRAGSVALSDDGALMIEMFDPIAALALLRSPSPS